MGPLSLLTFCDDNYSDSFSNLLHTYRRHHNSSRICAFTLPGNPRVASVADKFQVPLSTIPISSIETIPITQRVQLSRLGKLWVLQNAPPGLCLYIDSDCELRTCLGELSRATFLSSGAVSLLNCGSWSIRLACAEFFSGTDAIPRIHAIMKSLGFTLEESALVRWNGGVAFGSGGALRRLGACWQGAYAKLSLISGFSGRDELALALGACELTHRYGTTIENLPAYWNWRLHTEGVPQCQVGIVHYEVSKGVSL